MSMSCLLVRLSSIALDELSYIKRGDVTLRIGSLSMTNIVIGAISLVAHLHDLTFIIFNFFLLKSNDRQATNISNVI